MGVVIGRDFSTITPCLWHGDLPPSLCSEAEEEKSKRMTLSLCPTDALTSHGFLFWPQSLCEELEMNTMCDGSEDTDIWHERSSSAAETQHLINYFQVAYDETPYLALVKPPFTPLSFVTELINDWVCSHVTRPLCLITEPCHRRGLLACIESSTAIKLSLNLVTKWSFMIIDPVILWTDSFVQISDWRRRIQIGRLIISNIHCLFLQATNKYNVINYNYAYHFGPKWTSYLTDAYLQKWPIQSNMHHWHQSQQLSASQLLAIPAALQIVAFSFHWVLWIRRLSRFRMYTNNKLNFLSQ